VTVIADRRLHLRQAASPAARHDEQCGDKTAWDADNKRHTRSCPRQQQLKEFVKQGD